MVQAMRTLDKDYKSRFTCAPTVAKESSRLLLTIAASLRTAVATRNVSQAYVCTTHPLLWAVCIVLPADTGAQPDKLCRLRRPLYGMPKAGAMWCACMPVAIARTSE